MILGFRQKFSEGALKNRPSFFKEKILATVNNRLAGSYPDLFTPPVQYVPKIHTIRGGSRWKVGQTIQMAYGVRTKFYQCFNLIDPKDKSSGLIPELSVCISEQKIEIVWSDKTVTKEPHIFIDNRRLTNGEIELLAKNDGFDSLEDFYSYFSEDFSGQLINWTKHRY